MRTHWKPAVGGLALALALAVGGIALQQRLTVPAGGTGEDVSAASSSGRAVPVLAGTVAREDVPIWFEGIGTVQAFNSVTVRARVEGELQKIAFEEGQTVKAGDLLAQIDPRPFQAQLDQAQAKKAQDEALLANARRDLERNLNLKEFASRQQVDTQRAQVAQYEAQVRADQAAIDSISVQLGYTTITAPIGGRVGLRALDQGNIVRSGDMGLVTIAQIQPISVLFTLPERTLPAVQAAQAAGPVRVLALEREARGQLGEGTLTVVDNQIDSTTGTIRLKATFANDPQRLWPGQFVNVRLLAETRRNATVVPAPVVQRGPQGTYAYVIKDDQTVEQRPIKVGRMEDNKALIDEGLNPGERVVVDGQYRLQPGARISVVERPAGGGAATPAAGVAPASGAAGAAPATRAARP